MVPIKPATVREFEDGFAAALKGFDGRTRLNGVIKRIVDAETVGKCLDVYCRRIDPASPPKGDALIHGKTLGRTLFMRAAQLVGPSNSLRTQLDQLVKTPPPASDQGASQLQIWACRWAFLDDGDRRAVREEIIRTLNEAEKARTKTLLPFLIERYKAVHPGVEPNLDQLLQFRLASDAEAAQYAEWVNQCGKPWDARHDLRNRPPLTQNLDALDAAFVAFRARLDAAITTPLDFLRILELARRPKLQGDAWSFYHEVYLEVVAKGLQLALGPWRLESAYSARAFVNDDGQFISRGIDAGTWGKSRELLKMRLAQMKTGPAEIVAVSTQRRRLMMVGGYSAMELLDEIESRQLAQRMTAAWAKDPLEVVGRFIYSPSGRDVFNDRFWVNQQIRDGFTILWIETQSRSDVRAYVELHSIPGAIYKANGSALTGLNEAAFYRALAKNAQALKIFMLAYLEVLGFTLDVITAGATGGLRRVVWEIAKERIKDKMLEKGMTALGIDNPWLQTAAGFGANFVKLPKRKPLTPSVVEPPAPTRAVKDTPSGAEMAAQARAAAIANRTAVAPPASHSVDQRPRGALDVADPAPRPGSGVGEAAGARGARISGDDTPVINLDDVRRQRAAAQKPVEAKPVADAAKARSTGLDKRTEATGQKPITAAEDEAMEAAGVVQMRKRDADVAEAQARQQVEVAENATAVRAAGAGGGGGGKPVVGTAKPARGGGSKPGRRGGGGGSGRPTSSSRATRPRAAQDPMAKLSARARKLATPGPNPVYSTRGAMNTKAGQQLSKRRLTAEALTPDELKTPHYSYQNAVAGPTQWRLKVRKGYWRRERIVEPDGIARARDAEGKLDLIEAKWEREHIDFDNWDFRSLNWTWAGDKIDQMKRYAEAVRQNSDILDKARYCCSAKPLFDMYSAFRDTLPEYLRKHVVIELDPRVR